MAKVARTPKNATQAYLEIAEIRDDIVILRDGSYRSVLLCSSVNFDLKSEDEKNAIIYAYQAFINSLTFPLQILIRSRRINLDSYLESLSGFEQNQTNELIRLQTGEYIEFIRRLIEVVNIMEKSFYVVVPHFPSGLTPTGAGRSLFSALFGRKTKTPERSFREHQGQLTGRTQIIAQGLGSLGVRAAALNTQELIELFYTIYNPELSADQKLTQVGELTGPAVLAPAAQQPTTNQQPPAPEGQA